MRTTGGVGPRSESNDCAEGDGLERGRDAIFIDRSTSSSELFPPNFLFMLACLFCLLASLLVLLCTLCPASLLVFFFTVHFHVLLGVVSLEKCSFCHLCFVVFSLFIFSAIGSQRAKRNCSACQSLFASSYSMCQASLWSDDHGRRHVRKGCLGVSAELCSLSLFFFVARSVWHEENGAKHELFSNTSVSPFPFSLSRIWPQK